jgi:F0F1-type ATP synthase assembly protein I
MLSKIAQQGNCIAKEVRRMKDRKPDNNPWVAVARYSEIGFMIPASLLVGYFLGWLADRFLHTHWIYLFGIIFGAVAGFVSMLRRALQASTDEVTQDAKQDSKDDANDRP